MASTVESFVAGSSFGNGVTCNVPHWCIFPKGTALSDIQLGQLRNIFETPILIT